MVSHFFVCHITLCDCDWLWLVGELFFSSSPTFRRHFRRLKRNYDDEDISFCLARVLIVTELWFWDGCLMVNHWARFWVSSSVWTLSRWEKFSVCHNRCVIDRWFSTRTGNSQAESELSFFQLETTLDSTLEAKALSSWQSSEARKSSFDTFVELTILLRFLIRTICFSLRL